jgi:hypothetical protein
MEQPSGQSQLTEGAQSSSSLSQSHDHEMPVGRDTGTDDGDFGRMRLSASGADAGTTGSIPPTLMPTVKADNAADTAATLVIFIATNAMTTLTGLTGCVRGYGRDECVPTDIRW